MHCLRTFDPRVLLGDRFELTLYGMFAEAALANRITDEAALYARFISHFPEEANIHTPDTFRDLVCRMARDGYDANYPVEVNPQEFTLLNGAHRCAVAIQLGITSIPYSLRFRDDRVEEATFQQIFTPAELARLEHKREEYIARCEPMVALQCRIRQHMRRHKGSFETAFSSATKIPTLRLYQTDSVLGLPGKRPAEKRFEIYGLSRYLDGSMCVLEAGCNVGLLALSIATKVRSVVAFDADPQLVAVGEKVRQFSGVRNCYFVTSSVAEFCSSAPFDLVVSTALHGWVGEPFEQYARRVWSWVKPAGLVLFESHELDAELDWPDKRALLLANFDVLDSGLIDDVDDSMYESEVREFLVLRKRDDVARLSDGWRSMAPARSGGEQHQAGVAEAGHHSTSTLRRARARLGRTAVGQSLSRIVRRSGRKLARGLRREQNPRGGRGAVGSL